jgi:alpha-glutamyl/putrescinyl thymine pyrophosphorylase clade 1
MRSNTLARLLAARSYEQYFWILRELPLHGDFTGMQHLADLNYSPLLDGFDEDDYVRPGPGCVAGVNLCFGLKLKPSNASDMKRAGDVVRLCCDQQEQHFQNLGLQPVALLGRRRLKLIDIQNLYCEISKFSKLAFPKLHSQGATVRSYDPTSAPPLPPLTLPAKWRRFP